MDVHHYMKQEEFPIMHLLSLQLHIFIIPGSGADNCH